MHRFLRRIVRIRIVRRIGEEGEMNVNVIDKIDYLFNAHEMMFRA